MKQLPSRMSATALVVALLAASTTAFSQEQMPTRNANVWDWRAHQPTQAQAEQKEDAAGVAPSQSQSDAASATVNQLYRQLLDSSRS
jgi:hypothetical protein